MIRSSERPNGRCAEWKGKSTILRVDMTGELSKCVKKQLRELVYVAHEKALQDSLAKLGQHFDRWRRSEIDAIQFADLIREFDEGPNRDIYRRFTWSRNDLPRQVADEIHTGFLD